VNERALYRDESGRILGYFDPEAPDLNDLLAAARAERDRVDAKYLATLRRAGALWNRL
jgi:hypothetical protein